MTVVSFLETQPHDAMGSETAVIFQRLVGQLPSRSSIRYQARSVPRAASSSIRLKTGGVGSSGFDVLATETC